MDIKQIKCLVQLMVENDLTRIELREGDTHILLRRGHPTIAVAPGAALPTFIPPVHPPTPAAEGASPPPPPAEGEHLLRSPMVGTFYASADPESPAFVNVGDAVKPDTVVCLVEAMKVFNEIKAEVTGRITRILAKNAQAVEFDQPLFAVATA
jgi:acetyl-CoA carboxylase biotin carboxyl carrier protein